MRSPSHGFAKILSPLSLLCCLGLPPLAGCAGADRVIADPAPPHDYRALHPVELAEGRQSLALYVDGGGLDARSLAQIRQFAREARAAGARGVRVSAPREKSRQAAMTRRALENFGAPRPISTELVPTPIPETTRATPITLSFGALVARGPTNCGQWPEDLASGGTLQGWQNRPWWNYGCATQKMLSLQVADPRDLAGPAAETPPDAPLRQHAFDALRQGKDPTVTWTTQNNPANGSGGGS